MRYREDRGGEKERAEENNRSQDHKEKERSEKESKKRKDIRGNEQNADRVAEYIYQQWSSSY